MGDRTYTAVTVHEHVYNQLLSTYNGDEDAMIKGLDIDEINHDSDTMVELICYEANYGEMKTLEDVLRKANFEYDKHWQAGGNYGEGTMYVRNVNGSLVSTEIYQEHQYLIDFLKTLKDLTPDEVVKAMKDKIIEHEPFEITELKAHNALDFIKSDE